MPRWILHIDVNDPWLDVGGSGGCILVRALQARVDQSQPLPKGYVRSEYIGTLGCPPSPGLCANGLNRLTGLDQCSLDRKPLHNIDEGAITT